MKNHKHYRGLCKTTKSLSRFLVPRSQDHCTQANVILIRPLAEERSRNIFGNTKGFFICCTFFLLFIFFTTANGIAQNTTHQVKAGETLFKISEKYEVSIQQLREWNNLSSNNLSIDQQLVIKKQPEQSGITHTVEPKETLFSISKKYDVTIAEIKSWNNLQSQSLAIGTTLKIYPEKSTKSSSEADTSNSTGSYYTVKSGDSLFLIARLHNMSVSRLKRINDLSSNNIKVGQRLAVQATDRPPSLAKAGVESSAQGKFISYKIKERQSRAELLETFQMDETEFQALNPGLNATSFRRGDTVTILAPATRTFANPYTSDSGLSTLGTTSVSQYSSQTAEPTTSGELYNPEALTAAHSNIAMGSVIFIKNDSNKRGIFVRINDRTTGDGLKLSAAAWNMLGFAGTNAAVTMFRNNE